MPERKNKRVALDGDALVSERIMTLHAVGKEGVNIEKEKYDQMKRAIYQC
jgi:hypothetical protein